MSPFSSAADKLPLAGVKVLELAGLAPAPFAGMVLADWGADVVRVDRVGTSFSTDVLSRGKRSISVSLKSPQGVDLLRTMLSPRTMEALSPSNSAGTSATSSNRGMLEEPWRADVLIDPFRPGVLERLGLGPAELLKINPGLIIARLTGFRRKGPYSSMAGHDINYAALSGVLSLLGRKGEKPSFPANILADFAGGGQMAVMGILLALIERASSAKGQVIEVDMVTGTRYVSSFPLLMSRPSLPLPMWDQPRGSNFLDGGAPWYDVYKTMDHGYMSLGAIENHFYAEFLTTLLSNLPSSLIPSPAPTAASQLDRSTWPSLVAFFTQAFLSKSRDDWTTIFLGTDSCCVPVLERHEVDSHGAGFNEPDTSLSLKEKEGDGGLPSPAPRLVRTPAKEPMRLAGSEGLLLEPGRDTRSVLKDVGLGERLDHLLDEGAIEVAGSLAVKSKL